VAALVVLDARSRRWQGLVLVSLYVALAVGFGFAGERG
jgi:hypothetical protein